MKLSTIQKSMILSLSAIQKSITLSLTASLSTVEHIQKGIIDLQFVAQTTADIAAMLGQASYDMSLKKNSSSKV